MASGDGADRDKVVNYVNYLLVFCFFVLSFLFLPLDTEGIFTSNNTVIVQFKAMFTPASEPLLQIPSFLMGRIPSTDTAVEPNGPPYKSVMHQIWLCDIVSMSETKTMM